MQLHPRSEIGAGFKPALLLLVTLSLPAVGLFSWEHAEAQQAAKSPRPGSFALETGQACEGISVAECCEQKIEMAGLRTQGDYLPRLIKTTVQLACENEERVVTPQVCRSIATSRGFAPREVDAVCKPAARECKRDGTCRQCMDDLEQLSYRGSHHACVAVTYIKSNSVKTIVLRSGSGQPDSDTRFEIRKKRTELH
jgi:hypothetical protein